MEFSVLKKQDNGVYTISTARSYVFAVILTALLLWLAFFFYSANPAKNGPFYGFLIALAVFLMASNVIRSLYPVTFDPEAKTISTLRKKCAFSDCAEVEVMVNTSPNPLVPDTYNVNILLHSGKKISLGMLYKSKKVDRLVDEVNALVFGIE